MRIEIKPDATDHGVTPDEIRAVINHAALRTKLAPRKPGANVTLHIGPAGPHQPWLEVIVDQTPTATVVFHAMMLRQGTFGAVRKYAPHLKPKFARQRR